MAMNYENLLRLLKCSDADVLGLFRFGSRVYGTATPESDEDFVAVLSRQGQRQDLVFGPGVNIVVHTKETFESALASHSMVALECAYLPVEHQIKRLGPLPFRLDKKKLAASSSARSKSDYDKAKACFETEPNASKKKLFHAIRVPLFALQIARLGRLVDYEEALGHHRAIMGLSEEGWTRFETEFSPLREALVNELEKLAGKRR